MLILSSTQIVNELRAFEPRNLDEPSDDRFYAPEEVWLRDEFGPWCADNHPPYEVGKADCDDQVVWALDQARVALGKNKSVVDCGFALFRCDVLLPPEGLNGILPKDGIRSHSTILSRTAQGWRFFEPQNGQITVAEDWLWSDDALDFVLVRVRL